MVGALHFTLLLTQTGEIKGGNICIRNRKNILDCPNFLLVVYYFSLRRGWVGGGLVTPESDIIYIYIERERERERRGSEPSTASFTVFL